MFIRNRQAMETVEMTILLLAVAVLAVLIAGKLFITGDNGAGYIADGLSKNALPVYGE